MKAKVLFNKKINENCYKMGIESREFVKNAKPGQYLMVDVKKGRDIFDPLINRAFAVSCVGETSFSLLYKIVGKGTHLLSTFHEFEDIEISKPLGNTFTIDINDKNVAIIAGGIGIAPFLWLSKLLIERKNHITLYYGGKSAIDIVLLDDLKSPANEVIISTEDGTMGKKGLITDFVVDKAFDRVYMCGPTAMMGAAVNMFNSNCFIEVSMEEKMACGIGLCMGCIVYYNEDGCVNKKCCKDGPIFDGRKVLWQKQLH